MKFNSTVFDRMNSERNINWYLWTDGKKDYRLFDNPPNEPQGFSYDFRSLNEALNYASSKNLKVIFPEADHRKGKR